MLAKKNILIIPPTISTNDLQMTKRGADHNWWSPHYGVIRLTDYLNKNGHSAEYFDSIVQLLTKEDNFEKKLKEKKWDIIGFSLLNTTLISDIENIYLAKKICPDATLVAGGFEAQFNYQTVLDKTPCKIVVLAEGEKPLLMLANEVPLGDIPGIIFRNDAVPLSDEDYMDISECIGWEKIPYEQYWDLYLEKLGDGVSEEKKDAIHTARIFTTNRCPFKCKYCSTINQHPHATGGDASIVRLQNDYLIDLVLRIKKAHPRLRTIYFTDDDFCYHKSKVIDFCKRVSSLKLGVQFLCQTRITDLNEEVIMWLKKAGFRQLNIGIESFSQNVLAEIDKKCPKDKMLENLDLLEKYDLHAGMFMILITPKSSLEDIEETVDETLKRIKEGVCSAGASLACEPLKGTHFYEHNYDFMTEIQKIKGTNHVIKKDIMIHAEDPIVREVQLRHYREIEEYTEKQTKTEKVFHKTNFNKAEISLNFLKELIADVRKKYNLIHKKSA